MEYAALNAVDVILGDQIVKRSGKVDILEQDALKATDKKLFKYFKGIVSCYKNTFADPYWTGYERESDYERPGWRNTKIPSEFSL